MVWFIEYLMISNKNIKSFSGNPILWGESMNINEIETIRIFDF